MDLKDARIEDGRQIIPAILPIETSANRKLLNIRVDEQRNLLFALEFGARPALIVVDAVAGYIDPAAPIYAGVESAIPVISRQPSPK